MTLLAQIIGGIIGWTIAWLMFLFVSKKEEKQAKLRSEQHKQEVERMRLEMRSKYKTNNKV